MKVNYSNKIEKDTTNITQMSGNQISTNKPILKFAENDYCDVNTNISDKQIETELFKNKIMKKLDTSQSPRSPEEIRGWLNILIKTLQTLNGLQKNNLKPNGTKEQNNLYNTRIQQMKVAMEDQAKFIGSGLGIIQDPETGLYKLCINYSVYRVPVRDVEIVNEDVLTESGYETELVPKIVD